MRAKRWLPFVAFLSIAALLATHGWKTGIQMSEVCCGGR